MRPPPCFRCQQPFTSYKARREHIAVWSCPPTEIAAPGAKVELLPEDVKLIRALLDAGEKSNTFKVLRGVTDDHDRG